MTYVAPDITSPIDPNDYQAEIDENFRLTENALISIHNELRRKAGSTRYVPGKNLNWIDNYIANTNAIIGNDSFVISFGTDDVVSVTHPSRGSSCFMAGSFHSTDEVIHEDLSDLAPTDGSYDIQLAANSVDPPIMQLVLEVVGTDDHDLVLLTFKLHRSGSVFTVTEVRVPSPVVPSSSHADTYLDMPVDFIYRTRTAAIGTDGVFPVPFDCELVGAYAAIERDPTVGGTDSEHLFQLVVERGTEQIELLDAPFQFFTGEDDLGKFQSGLSTRVQLAEGEIIRPLHLIYDHSTIVTVNQRLQLILRRIFHPVIT